MKVDEQRIRDFAYQIWESEGQPAGQQQRHWDMAKKLVEAADSAAELVPGEPERTIKHEEVSMRGGRAPRKKAAKEKPTPPTPAKTPPTSAKKSAPLQSIGKAGE